MSLRYHRRADEVVTAFKDIIGESIWKQISDAHFQDLTALIRDAISDQVLAVAELVEKLAQHLRSETNIPELGLWRLDMDVPCWQPGALCRASMGC